MLIFIVGVAVGIVSFYYVAYQSEIEMKKFHKNMSDYWYQSSCTWEERAVERLRYIHEIKENQLCYACRGDTYFKNDVKLQ